MRVEIKGTVVKPVARLSMLEFSITQRLGGYVVPLKNLQVAPDHHFGCDSTLQVDFGEWDETELIVSLSALDKRGLHWRTGPSHSILLKRDA